MGNIHVRLFYFQASGARDVVERKSLHIAMAFLLVCKDPGERAKAQFHKIVHDGLYQNCTNGSAELDKVATNTIIPFIVMVWLSKLMSVWLLKLT